MNFKKTFGTLGVSALLLVFQAAYGAPQRDIAPFLTEIGFNQPIDLDFSLALPGMTDFSDAAFVVRYGLVSIVPNGSESGWGYQVNTGANRGERFATVPVARRKILKRTNQMEWTEGPIKLYAETIEYAVQFDKPLSENPYLAPIQNSLRLVIYMDPAIGSWKALEGISRGTNFRKSEDYQSVARAVKAAKGNLPGNTPPQEYIEGKISAAVSKSGSQAEQQFLAQGIYERVAGLPIVIQRSANLAYYTQPYDFPIGSKIGEARNHCASLNARFSGQPFSSWRMPTYTEMRTLIKDGRFLDTPNFNFFTDMLRVPNGLRYTRGTPFARFITDTYSTNSGYADRPSGTSPTLTGVRTIQLWDDGRVGDNGNGITGATLDQSVFVGKYSDLTRVVCVATPGPSGQGSARGGANPGSPSGKPERKTIMFSELVESLPDARESAENSIEVDRPYATAWAALARLVEKTDRIRYQNQNDGVIVTDTTIRKVMFLPRYAGYVMLLEPVTEGRSRLTFSSVWYNVRNFTDGSSKVELIEQGTFTEIRNKLFIQDFKKSLGL